MALDCPCERFEVASFALLDQKRLVRKDDEDDSLVREARRDCRPHEVPLALPVDAVNARLTQTGDEGEPGLRLERQQLVPRRRSVEVDARLSGLPFVLRLLFTPERQCLRLGLDQAVVSGTTAIDDVDLAG